MNDASGARPPAGLLAASLVGALLVLAPILLTAERAADSGWHQAVHLLIRPLVGALFANTLRLVVVSTLAAALLGSAVAWCVERTDLPGRRVWAVLAVVPLAIPAFVSSYAWVSLSPDLQDFWGAVLVVTTSYYPLLYLPVAASLRAMDPAIEETARALGCSPVACFFRVVLPQLRPALFGGMLLVALNVLTEYGAFQLLRFHTFTTEIFAEYQASFDSDNASLLALVLIGLCLACLVGELKVRGRAGYARIGSGARRAATRHPLGWMAAPIILGFGLLVLATVGVPLGMVGYWLTQPGVAAVTPAEVSVPLMVTATATSIGYGLGGTALTLVLALPIGYMAVRHPGRATTLIERSSYLSQGMPGVVVALAFIFLAIRYVQPLYQGAFLLVVAYAVQFLCLAVVGVRAALAHAQSSLEQTARSLGLNWIATAWRVMLPLAGPGLGASAAMVFISIVTELTTTLLLAPLDTQTLATQIWADTSTLAFAAAAPYTVALLILSFLSAWLLARRFGRSRIGLSE